MNIHSVKILVAVIFIIIFEIFFLYSNSLGYENNYNNAAGENDTLYLSTSEALIHASLGSLTGVVFGGVLGAGTAYLITLKSSKSEPVGLGLGIGAILGASIGAPIGTATFIYYGSGKNSPFWPLLFISAIPVAALTTSDCINHQLGSYPTIISWILAPIGATLYYELVKRDHSTEQSSLINIKESKLKFAFPEFVVKYNTISENCYYLTDIRINSLEYRINLVTIKF